MSVVLLASCGGAPPTLTIVQDANLPACANGSQSRWAAAAIDGAYVATAAWGGVDQDVIGAPGPAAWSDAAGQLYMLDPLAAVVHRFDHELTPLGEFGRRGQGPGELALQGPQVPRNSLAAGPTGLLVTDLAGVQEFDLDGAFVRRPPGFRPGGVSAITASLRLRWDRHGVFQAEDQPDRRSGERRVVVRWLHDGATAAEAMVPMPPLPREFTGYGLGGLLNQAQPLADFYGACAFVSDGASDSIVVLDVRAEAAGGAGIAALRVPLLPIPEETPEDRERRERMVETVRQMVPGAPGAPGTATVLRRWSALLVDPDGGVWLEAWRPSSLRHQRPTAVVVSGGMARVVELPAFPQVFGPPGVFFVVQQDPDTDVARVVRYGGGPLEPTLRAASPEMLKTHVWRRLQPACLDSVTTARYPCGVVAGAIGRR